MEIQYPRFNRPSSTITAAGLSALAVSMFWQLVVEFTEYEPKTLTVSMSVTFISALVGYLKKEKVLKLAE